MKIDAVLKAFEIGIDGERLSRHLAWREFEKLVNKILRRSDYQTEWNLTVTHKRERCQIDLLAYRGRIMLLIDCKHWKRPPTPSAELKMIEAQERRLRVLKSLLRNIYPSDEGFHELYLVPMVLALYQPSKRILNGHLFGSIGKLRSLIEYVESAYFHVRHEKVKI
ncbi:MAG: restriction endonuclease, partial [Thaumarchaeota archaeon]|nr:restriction endonuclease [Nitrososphaerota archaeon]